MASTTGLKRGLAIRARVVVGLSCRSAAQVQCLWAILLAAMLGYLRTGARSVTYCREGMAVVRVAPFLLRPPQAVGRRRQEGGHPQPQP